MKKHILTLSVATLAILSAASAVSAKIRKLVETDLSPIEFYRSLFSGNESALGNFGWLRSGCVVPLPDVRIVKPPSKGAIRFEHVTDVVVANTTELQKQCNGKQVDAIRLLYKAPDDFAGKDTFVLDVDTKLGFVKRYTFTMDVR